MRLFFIGDIVGKPARQHLASRLPALRKELGWELVIANGENAAAGNGITAAIAEELFQCGIDGITLGDHVWDQRGFTDDIDGLERLCRPANLPPGVPGKTHLILEVGGLKIGVFTLLGRNFMKVTADCPFREADRMLETLSDQCDTCIVEFHAETTSEKCAMGWYLDGRAAVVLGTHTHIPTADARLLNRGTAYITDIGMTGPYESCLGRQIQPVLNRFRDGLPRRFDIAEKDVRISGLQVDLDAEGWPTACELYFQG